MLRMMLRPRWIAALVLALGVAAGFAGLAQWQIERAASEAIVKERPTEVVHPIASLLTPGVATPQDATGQRMVSEGRFQAGDSIVVANRIQNIGDRTSGWWVVAHFVTDRGIDLPVVVGWAPSEAAATAAVAQFDTAIQASEAPEKVTGRFLPSDAPELPKSGSRAITAVAVGQLMNLWGSVSPDGAYFGYLISEQSAPGLALVSTPAPEQQAQLNLLNLFYGIEWATFAGFAIYLWWRLVRDAVERERERELEAGAEPNQPDPEPEPER